MILRSAVATIALVLLEVHRGSNPRASTTNKTFLLQQSPSVAYSPSPGWRLLVVTWSGDNAEDEDRIIETCDVIHDLASIEDILSRERNPEIEPTTAEQLEEVLEQCPENEIRRKRQSENNDTAKEQTTTEGYDGIPVVMPGTKWCGAGNRAESKADLGILGETDKCCRAHDNCDDFMAPGETRNNLTNESAFTALNCRCDDEFYDCLNKVNTVVSNSIGNTYFNFLRRKCYKFDYPDGECKKWRSFFKITCAEHEPNTTATKIWRWSEARMYKLPFLGRFLSMS